MTTIRRLDVASLALMHIGLVCGFLSYWLITAHGLNPLILVPSVAATTTGASHITKRETLRAGGVRCRNSIRSSTRRHET